MGNVPMRMRFVLNCCFLGTLLLLLAGCGPAPEPGAGAAAAGAGGATGSVTRIVSLAPNITEILFELQLGDRLVGVTRFCTHPPAARELPQVGGFHDIGYETIYALRPDLVILLPEHTEARQYLQQLQIPSLVTRNRGVDDILNAVQMIGEHCGASGRGAELATRLRHEVASVGRRASGSRRPTVLLSIGRGMGSEGIREVYVAGRGTLFNELAEIAGARNAYAGPLEYPTLDLENILRLNPEIIIDLVPDLDERGLGEEDIRSGWQRLGPDVAAVANGRIHVLSGQHILIPGPRFVQTLREMAAVLQTVPD